MAHDPAKLQKTVEAAMPGNFDWRFRPMFGGIGVYANDRMCVSLSNVGLAMKLTGDEHAALLAIKGAKPLQYEPSSSVSKTYVVVPKVVLTDSKSLGHWLGISADLAVTAPAKKARKNKAAARTPQGKPRRN